MKFKVLSREKVEQYNVAEKHIVISIRDIGSEKAKLPELENRLDELFLTFSDFDVPLEGIQVFNKGMAELTWNFIDKYIKEIDVIVVNCEAGISRSAGMTAAISKILNGEDDLFFKRFLPNMLVYKMMLKEKKDV